MFALIHLEMILVGTGYSCIQLNQRRILGQWNNVSFSKISFNVYCITEGLRRNLFGKPNSALLIIII